MIIVLFFSAGAELEYAQTISSLTNIVKITYDMEV